jgi:hypothetical protein
MGRQPVTDIRISNVLIHRLPKLGSTSLKHWLPDDISVEPVVHRYAVWRPSYERILSGLHTGFNTVAGSTIQKRYRSEIAFNPPEETLLEYHKELYMDAYHAWCENMSFYDAPHKILEHTRLLPDMLNCDLYIQWIHLDQLDLLPTYLNNKHNLNLPPIDNKNNTKTDNSRTVSNLQPKAMLLGLMKKNPNISLTIEKYSKNDYIPAKIIDISL